MKTLLRIIAFIGLKFLEIGAIIFVPYWVGRLIIFLINYTVVTPISVVWIMGLLFIALIVLMFVFVVYDFIRFNWRIAKRLIK